MNEHSLRESVCSSGKMLHDRGLATGSSGNISVRLDDGWLLTPTNASLGALDPARLSKLDWNGNLLSGDAASKEAFLHRAMYQQRGSAGAIVHLHSTYAAAVSCMAGLDVCNCLPPLTAYFVMKIGTLPLVPYYRPGDPKLADAIRSLATNHRALLLANHGPVVSGKSLDQAANASIELEETAKLFLLLRDVPTRLLNGVEIAELTEVFPPD